jgi:hypothetical protein
MGSLREQIKAAQDIQVKELAVPEWSVTVWVKTLTALEYQRLSRILGGDDDMIRIKTVMAACIDEKGKPIFQPGDETWLAEKGMPAIRRVSDLAFQLNAYTPTALEELRENFPVTQGENSPSG